MIQRVLVLADESADWKIAGLKQLDRIALSIQEYLDLTAQHHDVSVIIFWKPTVLSSQRWFPAHPRLRNVRFSSYEESLGNNVDLVLSTRVLIYRGGLTGFAGGMRAPAESDWQTMASSVEQNVGVAGKWEYLRDEKSVPRSTRRFLRSLGKPSDGPVSRMLNRPVSSFVSSLLLRSRITPNECSALIALLALPGCFFLALGSRTGFIAGTLLFQIFSMLDGCDGEIARAQFLESEEGRRFDAFCDLSAILLFVASLTVGLVREAGSTGARSTFIYEGALALCFLLTQWMLTRRRGASFGQVSRNIFGASNFASWLITLTKLDVVFLVFFALALFNQAMWILHSIAAFATISFALTLAGLRR